MTIPEYIDQIKKRYASGISTENSYRPDLDNLVGSIAPGVFFTTLLIVGAYWSPYLHNHAHRTWGSKFN